MMKFVKKLRWRKCLLQMEESVCYTLLCVASECCQIAIVMCIHVFFLLRFKDAMVAMVHSETTSGIINNVHKVGQVCKAQGGRLFFVDAMSSFGAVEDLNMMRSGISFLVSSSNKCIEGIPGFSYVLANTSHLMQAKGNARTLVLDLVEQR